ncbi:MAG: RNA polymerase subunit sigma [Betaproteobacteria bacterium HGW-Betaproteobacteria-4]|nr:MAG: RNA polymerase subunit sigma [Betaproteobacteria bacterium HGW-Betaproteobacteria-4]
MNAGVNLLIDDVYLAEIRRDMIKFAHLQLRDEAQAEDVVQEALVAALDNTREFAGRSAVKTWIFAILKNKIVDLIRLQVRTTNVSALSAEEESCLKHLPANTARVFMMREFLEFETAEVCQELSLTTSNCNVILHRARNGLRRCLESNWFSAGEQPC